MLPSYRSPKGMQFLLYLPCWLGVCELAGEWNEWQCPLRGAQRRILIKCCLLPSLTNTASLQWRGEAFGSKALRFRHQTRGKGWEVSLAGTRQLFFPVWQMVSRKFGEVYRCTYHAGEAVLQGLLFLVQHLSELLWECPLLRKDV